MKMLLKIVIGLVIVIVLGLLAVMMFINPLVKAGVEKGGTYALGVETTLGGASLNLLGGTLGLDTLRVANPEGYSDELFLENKTIRVGVDRGSLMSDTIRVREFTLDGMTIRIEQPLGKDSNVSAIMENVKRLSAPQEGGPEEDDAPGKKVIVEKVVITNITAYVQAPPMLQPVKVTIDKLPLESFDSEEGVPLPELMAELLPPIIIAVIEQGGGVLPADFVKDVSGDLAEAANALGGEAAKLIDDSSKAIGAGLEQAGKDLEKAGEGLKQGIDDLLKPKKEAEGDGAEQEKKDDPLGGLKNLLEGEKKEEN